MDIKSIFGKLAEKNKFFQLPADSLNTEEIGNFLDKHFPSEGTTVLHEMISEVVHIDVYLRPPSEEQPFYVLLTSGMSDLPMTFNKSIDKDFVKEKERAELMMFLPPDWDFTQKEDERWYWPIRAIKTAARFPHLYKTWFGNGHDLQFTEPCEPFAENTKLCALFFVIPYEEEQRTIIGNDGMKINVYMAVPIYEEELKYKLSFENGGASKLLDKLFEAEDHIEDNPFLVNINRINTCL